MAELIEMPFGCGLVLLGLRPAISCRGHSTSRVGSGS